jgi:hypothetical protein
MDTSPNKSTVFRPQTDGQSEAADKVIAMCLGCVTRDRHVQGDRHVPVDLVATMGLVCLKHLIPYGPWRRSIQGGLRQGPL